MALAMAWPCARPRTSVRKISKSSVPCNNSMRSRCSLVDILGEHISLPVECQGKPAGGTALICFRLKFRRGNSRSQLGQTRNRSRDGDRGFGRLYSVLNSVCEHINRPSRQRRNVNCCSQLSVSHPSLACLRATVTTREWQAKPCNSPRYLGNLLKGFARSHSHRVVLRTNKTKLPSL